MKKLLPLVFILFCFYAHAQTTEDYTQENNKALSFGAEGSHRAKATFLK